MGTIAEKLAYTNESITAIKSAVKEKNPEFIEECALEEVAQAILDIKGGDGGINIYDYYVAQGKEDNAYQKYYRVSIPLSDVESPIEYSDDDATFTFTKAGRYFANLTCGSAGGENANITTISIYKNSSMIATFTSMPPSNSAIHRELTIDAEEGDTLKVYTNGNGWKTVSTILFYADKSSVKEFEWDTELIGTFNVQGTAERTFTVSESLKDYSAIALVAIGIINSDDDIIYGDRTKQIFSVSTYRGLIKSHTAQVIVSNASLSNNRLYDLVFYASDEYTLKIKKTLTTKNPDTLTVADLAIRVYGIGKRSRYENIEPVAILPTSLMLDE